MNRTILLTGGSGVVGQALLQQLTATTVICLTRRQTVSGANLIAIPGDVTQPKLGLTDALFHSLARRVDGIVHSIPRGASHLPYVYQRDAAGGAGANGSYASYLAGKSLQIQ